MGFLRAATFAIALLITGYSQAVEVRFGASGYVDYVYATYPDPGLTIASGDPFTAEFWYDTSTPLNVKVDDFPRTLYFYRTGWLSIVIDGITVTSAVPLQVGVQDGVPGLFADGIGVAASDPIVTGVARRGLLAALQFNDPSGTTLSGSELPQTFSSLFSDNHARLDFVNDTLGIGYLVLGLITEVHPVAAVPEPSSVALMLGGLATIGLFRRRRSSVEVPIRQSAS